MYLGEQGEKGDRKGGEAQQRQQWHHTSEYRFKLSSKGASASAWWLIPAPPADWRTCSRTFSTTACKEMTRLELCFSSENLRGSPGRGGNDWLLCVCTPSAGRSTCIRPMGRGSAFANVMVWRTYNIASSTCGDPRHGHLCEEWRGNIVRKWDPRTEMCVSWL